MLLIDDATERQSQDVHTMAIWNTLNMLATQVMFKLVLVQSKVQCILWHVLRVLYINCHYFWIIFIHSHSHVYFLCTRMHTCTKTSSYLKCWFFIGTRRKNPLYNT
jgi:hypothetical protein